MNNIAIFYHIYQANHWEQTFVNQILLLQQTGLYEEAKHIHFGINGNLLLPVHLIKVNKIQTNDNRLSEADTLKSLYDFCVLNPSYKVLYMHTKGVSYPTGHPPQEKWLKYMEFFNIKKWKNCVEYLDTHDCVGVNWVTKHPNENTPIPNCYSGNFWWATAEYIKTLSPEYLYRGTNTERRENDESFRIYSEFWIGTGNPKYYSWHSANRNLYLNLIEPEEYEHI